jgi:hypothetical protein
MNWTFPFSGCIRPMAFVQFPTRVRRTRARKDREDRRTLRIGTGRCAGPRSPIPAKDYRGELVGDDAA